MMRLSFESSSTGNSSLFVMLSGDFLTIDIGSGSSTVIGMSHVRSMDSGFSVLSGEYTLDFFEQLFGGDCLGFERGSNATLVDEAMLSHNGIEFMDHQLGMSGGMSNDIVQPSDKNMMLSHRFDVFHL